MPTSRFLVNPAPESSELAAVEAPEQFEAEKLLLCLPTSNFLLNLGAEQFKIEKLPFCLHMHTYAHIWTNMTATR